MTRAASRVGAGLLRSAEIVVPGSLVVDGDDERAVQVAGLGERLLVAEPLQQPGHRSHELGDIRGRIDGVEESVGEISPSTPDPI